VARTAGGPVALLVAALHPAIDQVTTHAAVGRRDRLGRVALRTVQIDLLGMPTPTPITDTRSHE
jgi:hypothetical protein